MNFRFNVDAHTSILAKCFYTLGANCGRSPVTASSVNIGHLRVHKVRADSVRMARQFELHPVRILRRQQHLAKRPTYRQDVLQALHFYFPLTLAIRAFILGLAPTKPDTNSPLN